MNTIIRQGDTFTKRITVTYAGTRNPVDLTGFSAYCQLRAYPGQALICDAETSVNPEAGQVYISFSAEQTAALEPGEYGYDVRIVSSLCRRTIFSERITVKKPYTELE